MTVCPYNNLELPTNPTASNKAWNECNQSNHGKLAIQSGYHGHGQLLGKQEASVTGSKHKLDNANPSTAISLTSDLQHQDQHKKGIDQTGRSISQIIKPS